MQSCHAKQAKSVAIIIDTTTFISVPPLRCEVNIVLHSRRAALKELTSKISQLFQQFTKRL